MNVEFNQDKQFLRQDKRFIKIEFRDRNILKIKQLIFIL